MNYTSFLNLSETQDQSQKNEDILIHLVSAIQALNRTSQSLNTTAQTLNQSIAQNQALQTTQASSQSYKDDIQDLKVLLTEVLRPNRTQTNLKAYDKKRSQSPQDKHKQRVKPQRMAKQKEALLNTEITNKNDVNGNALYEWGNFHPSEDSSILELTNCSSLDVSSSPQTDSQKSFVLECCYVLASLSYDNWYLKDSKKIVEKILKQSSDCDAEASQKEAISWFLRKDVTLMHTLLSARITCQLTKKVMTQTEESSKRMIVADEHSLMKYITNNQHHKKWICLHCRVPEKHFRVDRFCKNTRNRCLIRSFTFLYSLLPLNKAVLSSNQLPSAHLSVLIDCTASLRCNMELNEDLCCLMLVMMDPGFQRFIFIANQAELSQLNAKVNVIEGVKTGLYTYPDLKKLEDNK